MKLYYRGLSYEYDPSQVGSKKTEQPFQPVPQIGSAYNLMYRGVSYLVDPNSKSVEVPLAPVTYQLSFRGITYFVNKTAQGKFTIASQEASTSKIGTVQISQKLKLQQ
ncbi:DUF4278 domain-containing protein [Desmonostoc muscorum LEGE 12446]|uniref:DUF4278 domain-containing protein n=1 Tax=Desmonostoc muscorum LEGE 12446 TaxID=1828758 RepID=A0A8J7DJI5_DESMC|nr:DUF4278 domain-containing protein [Desmonostoc muscorum]MCF2145265.1 DUF4278 domain-containing protein [Desmonostoc muscorum LEGE 12446]